MPSPGTVQPFSTAQFREELRKLIARKPAKMWLAQSSGHRLDTIFSIGSAQPKPIKMFDHIEGFYLLGEGVSPSLIATIHDLFQRYCKTHKAAANRNPRHAVEIRYRTFEKPHPEKHSRLIMHYPFAMPYDSHAKSDVQPV
jgi:hypothetical protein